MQSENSDEQSQLDLFDNDAVEPLSKIRKLEQSDYIQLQMNDVNENLANHLSESNLTTKIMEEERSLRYHSCTFTSD